MQTSASTTIKIDKGVPLPDFRLRAGRPHGTTIYPWETMEIGDSFAVPKRAQKNFGRQTTTAARKYGRKFALRKHGDGYRCWRIA
jgi:hypothetical protein